MSHARQRFIHLMDNANNVIYFIIGCIGLMLFYINLTKTATTEYATRGILYSPFDGNANLWLMHIPKTAGTWAYEKYYKSHPSLMNRDIASPQCGDQDTPVLVKGVNHATLGELQYCFEHKFPGERNYVVTQIRDPVDRVISEYYFFKNRMVKYSGKQKPDNVNWWTDEMREIAMDGSFEDWILMDDNIAHNRQSFYFLHEGSDPTKRTMIARPDSALLYRRKLFHREDSELRKELIQKFEQNVIFASVKGEELMSDHLFEVLFGRDVTKIEKKSHSSNSPEVSEKIREMIRERNWLDQYLYEYARGRLVEEYETYNTGK